MSEHDSREIQLQVHERLHARTGGVYTHSHLCHSFSLEDVVWETLALLGEWEMIKLEDRNLSAWVGRERE